MRVAQEGVAVAASEAHEPVGKLGGTKGVQVDLLVHQVLDEVDDLVVAGHVVVERRGSHAQAGGQVPHGQRGQPFGVQDVQGGQRNIVTAQPRTPAAHASSSIEAPRIAEHRTGSSGRAGISRARQYLPSPPAPGPPAVAASCGAPHPGVRCAKLTLLVWRIGAGCPAWRPGPRDGGTHVTFLGQRTGRAPPAGIDRTALDRLCPRHRAAWEGHPSRRHLVRQQHQPHRDGHRRHGPLDRRRPRLDPHRDDPRVAVRHLLHGLPLSARSTAGASAVGPISPAIRVPRSRRHRVGLRPHQLHRLQHVRCAALRRRLP